MIPSPQTQARDPLTGRWVSLLDPRRQNWSQHLAGSEDGTLVIGKTACGQDTVEALQVNNLTVVIARGHWVKAGLHPPE